MESLPDPKNSDRVVKHCPKIACTQLTPAHVFPRGNDEAPDLQLLMEHLKREGKIATEAILLLITKVTEIMTHEPNVVRLDDPVTIVGDLHGQFFDLAHILRIAGSAPPERSFLFLGDYVDRGSFSVEILIYLYAMKLAFPKYVYLLRGNHESRDMSQFFNFRDECLYKYDVQVFDMFIKSFFALPLAAIVNKKYLCMHGGISPNLHNVSQLFMIDRFIEPPGEGLFCDLLWADPEPLPTTSAPFRPNDARGCSYYYSNAAVTNFLEANDLVCLIRAHEVQLDGFKLGPKSKHSNLPCYMTIFSAPNYCDQYGNKGAILTIINDELDIVQFEASPHPFTLPNFMNVFDWSVPFVAEKVTELLHALVHAGVDDEPGPQISSSTRAEIVGHQRSSSDIVKILQDRMDTSHGPRDRLRTKMKTVARLFALLRSVRRSREEQLDSVSVKPVTELAASSSTNPLTDSLMQAQYSKAAEADFVTEKRRPAKP